MSSLTSLFSSCYELNSAIAGRGWWRQIESGRVSSMERERERERERGRERDVVNYIVNSNPATNASH